LLKFLSIYVCILAAALSAKTASAQAGVYALFTGANLDTTQTTETTGPPPTETATNVTTQLFGPTLGFYGDFPTPVVKIGGDIRGYLLNGSGKQHYNGVVGPRVAVEIPVVKLKPYGEFLFGFGSYKTTTPDATTHVDYEYVVGVDRKLFSLLDWRILEFSYCKYYNGTVPTKGLSAGLVLRIP
jgi:hypothetical protein